MLYENCKCVRTVSSKNSYIAVLIFNADIHVCNAVGLRLSIFY